MSLSAALGQSRAGLAAVSVWAEATSANISNADRRDYVRADVRRDIGPDGGLIGARVFRERTDVIDGLLRTASAGEQRQDAIASNLSLYVARLGQPGDAGSLGSGLAALETAFANLAAAPEQTGHQVAALDAADSLSRTFREISTALADTEARVREKIAISVGEFNAGLREARAGLAQGPDASSDAARDGSLTARLSSLGALADVRVDTDASGRITLHTPSGALLSDGGYVASIRFDASSGRLFAEGLVGQVEITPGAPGARGFENGRLAGEIELLNDILPRMRDQLDQLAGGVIAAFEGADGTLAAGDAGLFTDAGASLGAGVTPGLAQRIAVNDAVRPEAGGALWRLRDGLSATAPGPVGASAQVSAFVEALETPRAFDPAAQLPPQASLADYAGALVTRQAQAMFGAEDRRDTAAGRIATLSSSRDAVVGVDVDAELQTLLRIEQSYAANSRVIQSLTEMFDRLLAAT